MTAAAFAAVVAVLAQATAAPQPAPAQPPEVVQTQPGSTPQPHPPSQSTTTVPAAPPSAAPPSSDTQGEEPQTSPTQPDILGEGAEAQQAWEARLHTAYDDAQARQGPLDGRWRLTGADGDELFVLVISDTGATNLVGAWRDIRRGGGVAGSGYLSIAGRTADGVDIRFTEPGANAETVIDLRPTADGRWGGEMNESGAVRSVVMTRF